jgi:hypothetical protein
VAKSGQVRLREPVARAVWPVCMAGHRPVAFVGRRGDHGGDPYEQLLLLVFTQKNPARYSPT